MSGLRFIAAFAALPVLGWPVDRWLAPDRRCLLRVATAGAAGAVLLCTEMFATTLLGIQWSPPTLILPFALLWFIEGLTRRRRQSGRPSPEPLRLQAVPALGLAILGLAFVSYAAATARITSTDLVIFWGPKGQQFARAGRIDTTFLEAFARPDYPPLLPCLYAWATLVAERFAWGASLLTTPFFLALSALAFWAFAKPRLGARPAAECTAVLVFLQGFGLSVTMTAGAAEPLLLLFENIALSALVFGEDNGGTLWTASIALSGCALTKVEGLPFALIVSVVFAFDRRGRVGTAGRLATLALLPLALSFSWVLFSVHHGLLDAYRGGDPVHVEYVSLVWRELLKAARYDSAYLPWIAVLVLLAINASRGRGTRATFVGIAFLVFTFYVYLCTSAEPTPWIGWSAGRVLLTPLTGFFFAGVCPPCRKSAARGAPSEPSASLVDCCQ